MTWLKFVNVFFFQWLFVRLTKCSREEIISIDKLISYDIMPDGSIGSRAVGTKATKIWYSIQGFIIPCTGWWNSFIYIGEPVFWKITKEKISL